MKCPNCQTPMEGGYLQDHIWFSILPREQKLRKATAQVSNWFARRDAHALIALRCPTCARVELTAP